MSEYIMEIRLSGKQIANFENYDNQLLNLDSEQSYCSQMQDIIENWLQTYLAESNGYMRQRYPERNRDYNDSVDKYMEKPSV